MSATYSLSLHHFHFAIDGYMPIIRYEYNSTVLKNARICMYVCMHACMDVCMYVCIYVCMYVRMHACMHACMYVCGYAGMYVFMYVCVCKYKHVKECSTVCII